MKCHVTQNCPVTNDVFTDLPPLVPAHPKIPPKKGGGLKRRPTQLSQIPSTGKRRDFCIVFFNY